MSYCRFGQDDSDIYLFDHVAGYFECCGCSLGKDGMSTQMSTIPEVLRHLNKHIEKGDLVPEYAFDRLVEEAVEEIIEIIKQ
jgi:hypothetical protein